MSHSFVIVVVVVVVVVVAIVAIVAYQQNFVNVNCKVIFIFGYLLPADLCCLIFKNHNCDFNFDILQSSSLSAIPGMK